MEAFHFHISIRGNAMRSRLTFIPLFVAMSAASSLASAADGTITFNGNITSQTCTIKGNGGGKDFTVTLPTVSTATLSNEGKTAGRTPFVIDLSNCSAGSANVHAFFESGPTTDNASGNLILADGGATEVQIRLLNGDDGSPIKAGFADASQNSKSVTINAGTAQLRYAAEYVATGTAGAGAANTSVLYSIAYQ